MTDSWNEFEKVFREYDSQEFNLYLGYKIDFPINWCKVMVLGTILQLDELLLIRLFSYN